jgi:hypothetical protein
MKKIKLNEIQPSEEWLTRESVDYYLGRSYDLDIFLMDIEVGECEGQPFRYFVRDGNNRLYVGHMSGILEIVPRKIVHVPECYDKFAREVYDKGIRKWDDFENRIISKKERTRRYEEKHWAPDSLEDFFR